MMRALLTTLLIALGCFAALQPAAAIDPATMSNPALQARYLKLIHEFRCMQCQNETLADSPVGLAGDLRREVRELLESGKSDDDIRDYLVGRYGDFILFRPRFNWKTAWLWTSPFVLLAFGALVAVRVMRQRARLVDSDLDEVVDPDEKRNVTVFVLIAAALVAIAAAAVVVPLMARARTSAPPAYWAAIAVIAVLGGGGASLYAWLGNRGWSRAAAADSPQSMVGRLARRLEENPDDLDGWLLLGRSYSALEQFPLAARAYQHADQLSGGRNVEALTGLAEALVFDDQTQLNGRGGQLFERALQLDPKSGKALFYGAAVAERRGDLRLAKQRFQTLLDESPPAEVRPILERQIAALELRIAQDAKPPGAGAASAASPAPGRQKSAQTAATVPAAAVRIQVTLDPKIAARAPPGAPCFVFVRTPGVPGPPLAVRRVDQTFPQTVELTSADAMIAGHGIELNQDVEVIARISVSGTPQEHSGDLFGSARVRVTATTNVTIKIDQLSP